MVAHHRPPAPERTVPHARNSLLSHVDHSTGVGRRSNPATGAPGCRRTVWIMKVSPYLPDICPTAFLLHWKSRSDLCFGSLIRTYVVQRHDICPDHRGTS